MPKSLRVLFVILIITSVLLLSLSATLIIAAKLGRTELIEAVAENVLPKLSGSSGSYQFSIPSGCLHEAHDPLTQVCARCGQTVCHDYVNGICRCGKIAPLTSDYFDASFWAPCTHAGTVETITYTTHDAYATPQEAFTKSMEVYLPYGYNPSEKYNVLVLLHGNGGDEHYWFKARGYSYADGYSPWEPFSTVLDNMIDRHLCKPVIVVSPTYYLTEEDRLSGNDLSRDSTRMRYEVLQSILPAVISRYSTYAAGTGYSDMCAARDHFGFLGASYGGMIACNAILTYDIDVFSWLATVSGIYANVPEMNKTWQILNFSDLPINYLYTSAGENDTMREDTVSSYESLIGYSDKLTSSNCCYIDVAAAEHEERVWDNAVYNCLMLFFAGV